MENRITKSYRDLVVWQKAMELVIAVYQLTEQFPKSEQYGLVSQMRRAAVAIPSNVAEGYYRRHVGEYKQFLAVAYGSGGELETQVEICKRLPELPQLSYTRVEELLNEVMRLLNVFTAKLSSK